MLYFQIKDYTEFKDIFGTCKSPRGTIQNKILLAFWKGRFQRNPEEKASACKSMADMYAVVMDQLVQAPMYSPKTGLSDLPIVTFDINNKKYTFRNSKYSSIFNEDEVVAKGATDIKCCTVIDCKTKKLCSIKPSKIILDSFTTVGAVLPQSVMTYCAEIFQSAWEAERNARLEKYQLVVNKDFKAIYSSEACLPDFGSCMTDRGHTAFFSNSVDASAASLIDVKSGKIAARCIIWHNVKCDKTNRVYNYADRQYATKGDPKLKAILIERLYEEGHINIHKAVQASCRDALYICDRTGNKVDDPKLSVACTVKPGDPISYMDTFKYLDDGKERLYTYTRPNTKRDLSTTAEHL
jgi:hypothetical protein